MYSVQYQPRTVYPTLTYLDKAGYVTVAAEGSKRLTPSPTKAALTSPPIDLSPTSALAGRLSAVGERTTRTGRRAADDERDRRRSLPPLVDAALAHLRDAVSKRLEGDAASRSAAR